MPTFDSTTSTPFVTCQHNPWIVKTEIPPGLAAEHVAQALADLAEWSECTGRPLPLPAPWIVSLELRGFVVDLMTGEVFPARDTCFTPHVPSIVGSNTLQAVTP